MTTHTSRTAIVTGAAQGLGAAISLQLAAHGRAIGVVDMNRERGEAVVSTIENNGGKAVFARADVSNSDEVEAAVGTIADALGQPTILVNNAGFLRDNLLHRMTEADWDSIMSVHLKGTFLMTRTVQAHMVNASWGRIVNVSSTSALGLRGQANYAAAKAGIQGFTKAAAIELGRFGITVNAVAPGVTDTAMTRAAAERTGRSFDEYQRELAKGIAVGRTGTPEDVANAVDFFVDEKSGYVSGQVLYVSGGPVN